MMDLKPRMLITGSTGLLGGRLVRTFKKDFDVWGVSLSTINPELAHQAQLDLSNLGNLSTFMKRAKPDIVIHTAALTNVDLCEKDPDKAHAAHETATQNLIQSAKEDCYFVHMSTDAVFDGSKGLYRETDSPHPLNIYSETKLKAENIAATAKNHLILRSNIFGSNLHHGQSLTEWVISNLKTHKPFPMFTDVIFSPLYVSDLAEILKNLIRREIEGTLHVGAADFMSKCDFGKLVGEIFGLDTRWIRPSLIEGFPFSAKRPKNTSLDTAKLSQIVAKIPTIREGLKRMADERRKIR